MSRGTQWLTSLRGSPSHQVVDSVRIMRDDVTHVVTPKNASTNSRKFWFQRIRNISRSCAWEVIAATLERVSIGDSSLKHGSRAFKSWRYVTHGTDHGTYRMDHFNDFHRKTKLILGEPCVTYRQATRANISKAQLALVDEESDLRV